MKNLTFFALFIAANVFVGCDSGLYDDVPVTELTQDMCFQYIDIL